MGGEGIELQRTDSICQPPEIQLLEHVRTNNVPKIKGVVSVNPSALHANIGHPFDKPILYIACYEFANYVKPETIGLLVSYGADLHYSDELHNHKEALHFAALGLNPTILQTIVDKLNNDEINSTANGNTALTLLIKEGDINNKNFMPCVLILLRSSLDVNRADGKNLTAIFWAAKKNYKEVASAILNESGQLVDLDSHTLRGKSARDLIIENNLLPIENLGNVVNNNESNIERSFGYLKEYDEDGFVNNCNLRNSADTDDGEVTLLQMATKKGLARAVEFLLNNGADPTKFTWKTRSSPVEIAAAEGYHAILGLLLNHEKATISNSNILIEVLENIDNEITQPDINYNLCYDKLMEYKSKININACDKNKNTALHYAARYGGAERTLDLLRAGASMAAKNKYGVLPIEEIDANTLETHLDECIEINLEHNVDKENFIAVFNYKTLMPSQMGANPQQSKYDCDTEASKKLIADEMKRLKSETLVISYMSGSPELKHLLKHPVITSFLYIKWHRIRWFFYTNLGFYIAFFLSLILYILLIYSHDNDYQFQTLGYTLSALFGITFTLLTLREVFQIAVSPKTYFKSVENWVELLLISFSAIILFQPSPGDDLKKQVSAIVILLAAFELVILIGQHPKMSTNIVMLRTVSANFFKFLLWYSILIIAFSLSFYTLFKNNDKTTTKDENSDDPPNFFISPGLSLFKTIVMLTGEFEAGEMSFEIYPITSHIIFMLFVFMIAIILLNLLNGLAVSDTQVIKSNAELVGHISRIEHIAYVERMILGNILPKWLTNIFVKYCCCLPAFLTDRFLVPGILVRRVCLFPYFLKEYRMIVLPNVQAKVVFGQEELSHQETCIKQCTSVYLDKQTAKRTKQLIRLKKDALEKKRQGDRVTDKQNKVILQQQMYIEELKKEQTIILNKLDYIITNMSI